MSMIKFTAFRTQKPRQFEYMPRHYDPERERREERRKELRGSHAQPLPESEYKPGEYVRRSAMGRRGMDRSMSTRHNPKRPLRLVIILVMLIVITWALINSNAFAAFMGRFLQ